MSIKLYNHELQQWEIIVPLRGEEGDQGPQGPPGPVNITDALNMDSATVAASSKAVKLLMDELNALKSMITTLEANDTMTLEERDHLMTLEEKDKGR